MQMLRVIPSCAEGELGCINLPSLFEPHNLDFLPLLFYFSYNKASKGKLAMVLVLVQGFRDPFQSRRNNWSYCSTQSRNIGLQPVTSCEVWRVFLLNPVLHLCLDFKILTSLLIYPLVRCLATKCAHLGLK